MRGIYSHFKDEDPFSIDYPFNNELYNQGLKKSGLNLGYIVETDSFEVHPSIKRAINETVRSLEAQGHNLIKLDIGDDLEKLAQAVWEAVFALGPEVFLNNNLKGEQLAD
jgi:Asp-tRNA(Asn)/Glu-tRNA(Gln) amidotransferase A subunit family amidase